MTRVCKKCGVEKPLELFVKNGQWRKHTCKACDAARVCAWQKENPERVQAKNKQWLLKNPVKAKAYTLQQIRWVKENPEKRRVIKKRYDNSEKGKWHSTKDKRNRFYAQHSPKWRNNFFVAEVYDLARRRTKATNIVWHVDHIIPINHPKVSGLHVETNLQVIPASINCSKRNNFVGGI